ncbi:hypothetical protein C8J56DRAFT_1065811 [Mycena floridula]|nr:hypothetical protein C8J56DRAFT_1065811 [Mycena floridula]
MSESYKFVYFAVWGLSDISLMALQITGAKYENVILSREQFAQIKTEQKFGRLPRLDVKKADGTTRSIWESRAIELYLGEKLGLLPTDPFDKAESISILSSLSSLRDTVSKTRILPSPDLRAARHEKHITETIPEALNWHESIIAGPYYAGNSSSRPIYQITLPDLALLTLHLIYRVQYSDRNPLIKFPKIRVLVETLLAGKLGEHAVNREKG